MKIYPKISDDLKGLEALKEIVKENGGVEIQFFHKDGIWGNYDFVPSVEKIMKIVPELKEITIHPPLANYDLELVLSKDINIVKNKIEDAIKLSKKYNIKMNLLYHVAWPIEMLEQGTIEKIKEVLKLLENTNVNIIIENVYSVGEDGKCIVLDVCKIIDNPHLKICLDTCHIHCLANLWRRDFDTMLPQYLDKNIASKYIYQIHFSDVKNNDGYIKRKTHGRKHDDLEGMRKDYRILVDYNLTNKNIIPEISEENYEDRKDQLYEIKLLKEAEKNKLL